MRQAKREYFMGCWRQERRPRKLVKEVAADPGAFSELKKVWRVQARTAGHARGLIAGGHAELVLDRSNDGALVERRLPTTSKPGKGGIDMPQIGDNIQAEVIGDQLTLAVDLGKPGTVSRSGKSQVIASTRGNVKIADSNGDEVSVGINIYRSR